MTTNRNSKGQFLPGHDLAALGGRRRAEILSPQRRKEIARMGFNAMVNRYFGGDRGRANAWLSARGLAAQDPMPGNGYNTDPGPHPAHR